MKRGSVSGAVSLVMISALHTVGAVNTIDRIIDVFPRSSRFASSWPRC